jgi:hypothetical protein
MSDRTSDARRLFDQDASDAHEAHEESPAGLISTPPSRDCPRQLAAMGLAIVELNRSSQLLAQMIGEAGTSQS